MNILKIAIPTLCLLFASCTPKVEPEASLNEAFADKFLIGTAVNVKQTSGRDSLGAEVIKKHFGSIVAENCMKSMYLQPIEGEFYFDEADRFVAFGEQNNKHIVGHTLIWHSQAPQWFFVDDKGQDVSREVLIERMKNHITTVVTRYKGAIKGWDVLNEAFLEDGTMRNSKFREIIGDDYIKLAFQFAHEADPDAELYYNDYNEWYPGKRDAVVNMVKSLKEEGIRIDGVGMQGHMGMQEPTIADYETAIEAYTSAGVKVMITEWDISPLPSPRKEGANITDTVQYRKDLNPYTESLAKDVELEWAKRYKDFFALFLKHQDNIDRVTLWGVSDLTSWKNDFPVKGRTDYPLLFDRSYKAKPVVQEIIELTKTK